MNHTSQAFEMATEQLPQAFPRLVAIHSRCDNAQPTPKGKLVPLRTKAEVQASRETTSVFIVEVPNKAANALLNLLRHVVPFEVTAALQHLRRFAKPEFLPGHLRASMRCHSGDEMLAVTPSQSRETKSTSSHFLVCPTTTVTSRALDSLFQAHRDLFEPLVPVVHTIDVPVFAPTSAAQAAEWSSKYWPTTYKNTNPYGPHPSLVRRAEMELLANGEADQYMAIARNAGREAVDSGVGCDVGAVIVERLEAANGTRIVAVASDSRFTTVEGNSTGVRPGLGNPMAHAALRAIGLIAQKRHAVARPNSNRDDNRSSSAVTSADESVSFATESNKKEEQPLAALASILPDGYLCVDLEIYLTHEPCVMCSMAILHSRFARTVFEHSMPDTGGLLAEQGSLRYGLGWRDELNWKFLSWQWRSADEEIGDTETAKNSLNFHA